MVVGQGRVERSDLPWHIIFSASQLFVCSIIRICLLCPKMSPLPTPTMGRGLARGRGNVTDVLFCLCCAGICPQMKYYIVKLGQSLVPPLHCNIVPLRSHGGGDGVLCSTWSYRTSLALLSPGPLDPLHNFLFTFHRPELRHVAPPPSKLLGNEVQHRDKGGEDGMGISRH